MNRCTQLGEILREHVPWHNRTKRKPENFKVKVTGPDICILYYCKIWQKSFLAR